MAAIHHGGFAQLCRDALLRVGAGQLAAQVLAEATVEAELIGNRAVGVAHLFDYLDGYQKGRIAMDARPVVRHAAPAVIDVDACDGLAQSQASSSTAFVNIRRAAEAGETIPAGWALGPDGEQTQDAVETSPCWWRSSPLSQGPHSPWTQHRLTAAPPHQASASFCWLSIPPSSTARSSGCRAYSSASATSTRFAFQRLK
jgi:Malate/L-lactate dehydrogenase